MSTTKPFYTVSETAALLGVAISTVTAGIKQKNLAAIVLTDDHRSTRIAHETLFPSESAIKDMRIQKLRRMVLEAATASETAKTARHAWLEAQANADTAVAALRNELGLQELDSTLDRLAG